MVSRVPLLGMVLAIALLIGENLGANAYVAAKQREADAAANQREADAAAQRREDATVDRLIEEIQRRNREIEKIREALQTGEMFRGELAQKQLEIARMHLEAEKLRREH